MKFRKYRIGFRQRPNSLRVIIYLRSWNSKQRESVSESIQIGAGAATPETQCRAPLFITCGIIAQAGRPIAGAFDFPPVASLPTELDSDWHGQRG